MDGVAHDVVLSIQQEDTVSASSNNVSYRFMWPDRLLMYSCLLPLLLALSLFLRVHNPPPDDRSVLRQAAL